MVIIPHHTARDYFYVNRITFTGKERDEETGYGYFGARYIDHELMTIWLSVDPKADKYPSISPYAYCAWNPVKLVDPDGMDIWIGLILYSANMSSEDEDYDDTTLDLADEIAHAFDAVNGWAYKRQVTKDGDYIDDGIVNGYDKREFQAAYRVNVIREQMGNNNYRTKYYSSPKIADKNTFFRPCWYTLRTTDDTQRIVYDIPQ